MSGRIRMLFVVVAILFVGVVEAGCPPVLNGYTTTYYQVITCHGTGCTPQQVVVGQCTLECDGSYSCWGQNTCSGLTRCRTTYTYCGDCTPDY